jgi:hypothetical protein
MGGICQQGWANQSGYVYENEGCYYLWNHGGLNHKKRLPLLHWAGISEGPTMPERSWFLQYRYGRNGIAPRIAVWLKDVMKYPCTKAWEGVRSQRHINQLYHSVSAW